MTHPYGPGSLFEEMESLIESITEVNEQIAHQIAQDRESSADEDQARAEAARTGELGKDWQIIQRRIDRGETSLEAVFSGEDTSIEARHLRDDSEEQMRELIEKWGEMEENGESTPRSELASAWKEFEERNQQISDQIDRELNNSV